MTNRITKEADDTTGRVPGGESAFGTSTHPAQLLRERGYSVVSVVPPEAPLAPTTSVRPQDRGKAPGRKGPSGWAGYNWLNGRPSERAVAKIVEDGASVGVRADYTPGLDIDVDDPQLAELIRKRALEFLGDAPVRLSKRPRCLLPYRTDEPISKMICELEGVGDAGLGFEDGTYKVELLGAGQQYLVHGPHPSGSEYSWQGSPLWEYAPEDLTTITAEQVTNFFDHLRDMFKGTAVSVRVKGSSGTSSPRPQEDLEAPDVEAVQEAVGQIPNDYQDRADYIKIGCAIKAALPTDEGTAFEIWSSWADRWEQGENTPETLRADWGRMHAPFRVGWGFLANLARERGDFNPAQYAFEADPDEEADDPSEALGYTLLSDVEPERVDWLWQNRIPFGKATVLDGDPGLGKSGLTLDLAARVTTGREMPDGSPGLDEPAAVVILSAEDGLGDTVRPRLEVAGGDVNKVAHLHRITVEGRDRFIRVQDADRIEAVVKATGARLIVVDPLMSFLGTKDEADSYRDQDVRAALLPLTDMAKRTGAAVVLVRHLTKHRDKLAILAGGGSMGIIGAARAGFLVAKHPADETRRVFAPTKTNLAPTGVSSLVFRLEGEDHPVTGDSTLRIDWAGPCPLTADSLVRQDKGKKQTPALDEAKTFLRRELASGPKAVKELRSEVRDAGLGWRTVRRAKADLGVNASRDGGLGEEGAWSWSLPNEFTADLSDVIDVPSEEEVERPGLRWDDLPDAEPIPTK